MKEKIRLLNEANKAYYQEDREIMSNYEYDKLYDELKKMEEETGVVLSNSPTLKVGYAVSYTHLDVYKRQHSSVQVPETFLPLVIQANWLFRH